MPRRLAAACLALAALLVLVAVQRPAPGAGGPHEDDPRVLVFTKTAGWRHSSIPHGVAAIRRLGEEHGFAVDATEDAASFREETLRGYRAVVFLNTTRNVLDRRQQTAFERYIQAGGGFVGIHSAAATEYEWPWYGQLVGARLTSHPNHPNVREAVVEVVDRTHASTRHLPERWTRSDEWYNYRDFYPGIRVLAELDEETYDGGTNGAHHPIAWYHAFDGGRAFYTGGGHVDASFSEPRFLRHLLGGIRYAMGDGTPLDYGRAYARETPEENRFVKTTLVDDLDTPMELAVAEDGRVFYTELDGRLSVYDPARGEASVVHAFDVARRGGTGLIGITLDPRFDENGFLYLYYSPPTDAEPIDFRLSRFTVDAASALDLASERVLLTVPVEENSGSHHGGSLAWDADGNLFLSTGDSSSPFPADGYAPLDERPGAEFYALDAQRSSANTNDLKGKILRIHPEPDGSYTIPEGNLFPPGTDRTRPEIFAMGMRNPYRIAVNPATGAVYWGDIGPDAGEDSDRGPRGYDEFNRAAEPGNFGWPYFIGDNYAYADWDFAAGTPGPRYEPDAPVNDSPNNTGLRVLPAAEPAMIWYPYAASERFPELGEGGRSAMAGAFYTHDAAAGPGAFPAYYDGALFVFDWMRNWVLALRVDAHDAFVRSEPFMASNGDFRRPIDLAFSRDGMMYMLEYGSVYGVDNDDARLVRIAYDDGNRPPVASARVRDETAEAEAQARSFLTSDRRYHTRTIREAAGPAPLTVSFGGRGDDPDDGDALRYAWRFDGETVGATEADAVHTYARPGVYHAVLEVTDRAGAVGTDTLTIRVGNARPEVRIETTANRSFYWPGQTLAYAVSAADAEDGPIDPGAVDVSFLYSPRPHAAELVAGTGSAEPAAAPTVRPWGETLIAGSDCGACHTVDAASVGPSFVAIADRYKGRDGATELLAEKIIHGGGGSWGTAVMSAHPQLSDEEAEAIVRFIFSLTDARPAFEPVPASGRLALDRHGEDEPHGRYVLRARYTDRGAPGAEPLAGGDVVVLRDATVETIHFDAHPGFTRWGDDLASGRHKAHLLLRDVDLTGIGGFTYAYASGEQTGAIEVRVHSYAGPVVSRTAYPATGDGDGVVRGKLDRPLEGRYDVYFIVRQPTPPNGAIVDLHAITFDRSVDR